jgi:hypothetical protein
MLGSKGVMALLLSVLLFIFSCFVLVGASISLLLQPKFGCCFQKKKKSLVRTFFIDNVSDVRVVAFEHAKVGICRFYESRLCP